MIRTWAILAAIAFSPLSFAQENDLIERSFRVFPGKVAEIRFDSRYEIRGLKYSSALIPTQGPEITEIFRDVTVSAVGDEPIVGAIQATRAYEDEANCIHALTYLVDLLEAGLGIVFEDESLYGEIKYEDNTIGATISCRKNEYSVLHFELYNVPITQRVLGAVPR